VGSPTRWSVGACTKYVEAVLPPTASNVQTPSGDAMAKVKAYAATAPTELLAPHEIERREVGPHDVLIEIAYGGICHSDLHPVKKEWGKSN